jgi:hypothetical protein
MIKISDLRDKINEISPFDRVLLMHAVTRGNNNIIPIHSTEHYPGFGIAQIDFNVLAGEVQCLNTGLNKSTNALLMS